MEPALCSSDTRKEVFANVEVPGKPFSIGWGK